MSINTKMIDTDLIKQSVDLRDYAGRYTTLSGGQAKELYGPCPKCGGDDRFHCQADWFFCRDCHSKRGDAIEFVMWKDGCDFQTAAATLTNAPVPTPEVTKRRPAQKQSAAQPRDWGIKAASIAEVAHRRLFDDSDLEAEAGRRYLESRGIEPHTWRAFNLGFTSSAALPGTEGKQRIPAIVIPWYRAGKVVAIRYRFLKLHEYTDSEGKQRREKQTALPGSSFAGVLYGGQALDTGIAELSTLLICEGELNACSIWQASCDTHLDVLSLGSESASITPAMVEHAKRYATVICWLDKEERAKAVMSAFLRAYGIKSPNGQDANDLLQAGTLGGFLALHRYQASQNRYEQERLLWDLVDASRAWNGMDKDAMLVCKRVAKTLGKSVSFSEVRAGVWRAR